MNAYVCVHSPLLWSPCYLGQFFSHIRLKPLVIILIWKPCWSSQIFMSCITAERKLKGTANKDDLHFLITGYVYLKLWNKSGKKFFISFSMLDMDLWEKWYSTGTSLLRPATIETLWLTACACWVHGLGSGGQPLHKNVGEARQVPGGTKKGVVQAFFDP